MLVSQLQADNVELVGRIKYLQSYKELAAKHASTDVEASVGSGVASRYSEQYEATLNPFAAFHRDERVTRYKALNPAEKLLLNTSQFFLATKATRLALFGYIVVLHALVFLTLWNLVHL